MPKRNNENTVKIEQLIMESIKVFRNFNFTFIFYRPNITNENSLLFQPVLCGPEYGFWQDFVHSFVHIFDLTGDVIPYFFLKIETYSYLTP